MRMFSGKPEVFAELQIRSMKRSNGRKERGVVFDGVQTLDSKHWEFGSLDDNQKLMLALMCLTMTAMPFGVGQGDNQAVSGPSLARGLDNVVGSLAHQAFQAVDGLVPGSSPQVNRVMAEECGIRFSGGRSEAVGRINEELGLSDISSW